MIGDYGYFGLGGAITFDFCLLIEEDIGDAGYTGGTDSLLPILLL